MPGRGRVPNVPKTAVVGSRTYPNLSLVRHYTRALVARGHVIVTGGAIGVDVTAEQAASSIGGRVIVHEPDWSKRAHETDMGPLFARNTLIVQDADQVVAFWDGSSRGTLDVIRKAAKAGKMVLINPGLKRS